MGERGYHNSQNSDLGFEYLRLSVYLVGQGIEVARNMKDMYRKHVRQDLNDVGSGCGSLGRESDNGKQAKVEIGGEE